jgi:hypothetical protein
MYAFVLVYLLAFSKEEDTWLGYSTNSTKLYYNLEELLVT